MQILSHNWITILTLLSLVLSTRGGRGDDEFTEPDGENFAYPVPWLKSGPVKDRMHYSSHRNQLLITGWGAATDQSLRAAQAEYDAARQRYADDPRLDYAFGLVLWRHGRTALAIQKFDEAARLKGPRPPFLPAAQAAAWARLLSDQREAGLRQIVEIAMVLNKARGTFPTKEQKDDSALFLGRAVEFLTGPGAVGESAESDQRHLDQVTALIPADSRADFQLGRNQIDKRYEDLKALASRPADEIEAEFEDEKLAVQQRIADCRAEVKRLDDELLAAGKTQRQASAELNARIAALTQELVAVNGGLKIASAVAASNAQPARHYETITTTRKRKNKDGETEYEDVQRRVERPETAEERSLRLQRLNAALAEGTRLLTRKSAAAEELLKRQAERKQSTLDFVQSQAARRKEKSRQYRLKREADVQAKQIEQDYVSPEELRARLTTIAPYVPWDVDVEREALLESYRITVPESAGAVATGKSDE